ncbi:MAG: hypothetical protein J7639_14200 [Paenibacillaceae bacterium]|nr:hypothetical protein [Paenibacillaceae bacterium]
MKVRLLPIFQDASSERHKTNLLVGGSVLRKRSRRPQQITKSRQSSHLHIADRLRMVFNEKEDIMDGIIGQNRENDE